MLDRQEQIFELLKERIVSEKSQRLAPLNVIVFKVRKSVTKQEVAQAVEIFFETKVKSVNLLKAKGKVKRAKGRLFRQSDWKKAYITLHSGELMQSEDKPAATGGEI